MDSLLYFFILYAHKFYLHRIKSFKGSMSDFSHVQTKLQVPNLHMDEFIGCLTLFNKLSAVRSCQGQC